MSDLYLVIYFVLGCISFLAFLVMDIKVFGEVTVGGFLVDIVLAAAWPVIWVSFIGAGLGWVVMGKKTQKVPEA